MWALRWRFLAESVNQFSVEDTGNLFVLAFSITMKNGPPTKSVLIYDAFNEPDISTPTRKRKDLQLSAEHKGMPKKSYQTLEQRLWAKIVVGKPDECWSWRGTHNPRGLPMFAFDPRDQSNYNLRQRFGTVSTTGITAQRVLWGVTVGDVPMNRVVFHVCGTRGCVNPNHLRLGSKQDQANRRVANGRQAFGERNTNAKLTPAIAAAIYSAYHVEGLTQKSLAKLYGVDIVAIQYICAGHTWSHATGAQPSNKFRKALTSSDQHSNAWFNKNKDPRWKE